MVGERASYVDGLVLADMASDPRLADLVGCPCGILAGTGFLAAQVPRPEGASEPQSV